MGFTFRFLKLAMMSSSENWPCAKPTMRVSCPLLERSEGQLFNVVVLIEAGGAESLLQLLQLRRKHTRLEIHRGWRVLHGVVIDDDQLLNILRNCGARILAELSGSGG